MSLLCPDNYCSFMEMKEYPTNGHSDVYLLSRSLLWLHIHSSMHLHQCSPDNVGSYFILMCLINCRAGASPSLTLQMTGDCLVHLQPMNQIFDHAHDFVFFH